MRTVWTVAVGCLVLGLVLARPADAGTKDIDKTKLVGVWEPAKSNGVSANTSRSVLCQYIPIRGKATISLKLIRREGIS